MPRKIAYDPFDFQLRFHQSRSPKVYLSGGYGCGKTYSLVRKMFGLADANRGLAGGILVPNLKMYKRDVAPTIREICQDNGIRFRYNKSDSFWYFPDCRATVYVFHAEDEGRSIRGPNLAWGVINEVTLIDYSSFAAFLARVRDGRAKLLQLAMSGTPEGFNWAYDYFIMEPREDTELIFGDTRKNTKVHQNYVGNLLGSYDALMSQQFVEGKFVNLNGKACAWAFDRRRHTDMESTTKITKVEGAPVWVSLDFNVSPMAATLWNVVAAPGRSIGDRGTGPEVMLQAFDEIGIDNGSTWHMSRAIRERTKPEDEIIIFPDPAGRARSTKSNVSDFDILKQEGFADLRYRSSLSVRDCLNSLNSAFFKGMIRLSAKNCRQTVADLEQCTFKTGVFEIDKKDPKRTHWLDGLKNMVDYEFPVRRPTAFREERIR